MQELINRAKDCLLTVQLQEFWDGKPEICLTIRNRLTLKQKNL